MSTIMTPDAENATTAGTTPASVEAVVAEIVDNLPTEATPRPHWLTGPCPAWCTETHTGSAFYGDRTHTATPGQPLDLSLVDERAEDGLAPATLDVSLWQHYRSAEATVVVTVPTYDRDLRLATGQTDLEITPTEARALRDRLDLILAMVNDAVPLDVELGESHDGASRRSIENTTRLNAIGVDITTNLLQWTEHDAGPELEVEIDIAANPANCSVAAARATAHQLRQAADRIDRLAQAAAAANARIGGAL